MAHGAARGQPPPAIPAIAETIPGFDFAVVIGAMAAAGTPPAAIDRLAREIAEVVKHPEVARVFQAQAIDAVGAGPADYGRVIERENEAMARAARAANLKAE